MSLGWPGPLGMTEICGLNLWWMTWIFYTVFHITLGRAGDLFGELIEMHIQCCDEVYDTFHGLNRKSTFGSHPHSHVHLQVLQLDSSVSVEHFILKELKELSKFECKTISKPWHCHIVHAKRLCWILTSISPFIALIYLLCCSIMNGYI